jgi:hypothetical protein
MSWKRSSTQRGLPFYARQSAGITHRPCGFRLSKPHLALLETIQLAFLTTLPNASTTSYPVYILGPGPCGLGCWHLCVPHPLWFRSVLSARILTSIPNGTRLPQCSLREKYTDGIEGSSIPPLDPASDGTHSQAMALPDRYAMPGKKFPRSRDCHSMRRIPLEITHQNTDFPSVTSTLAHSGHIRPPCHSGIG